MLVKLTERNRPASGWHQVTSAWSPARLGGNRASPLFRAHEAYIKAMGGKQYSPMLGLSRGYPYILYLKQLTGRMRDGSTFFPQSASGVTARGRFFSRPVWEGVGFIPRGNTGGPGESKSTCASSKSRRGQIRW